MKRVTVHEAKTHLSKLLRDVERGGEFVIVRRDEPVARLTAVSAARRGRELGRLKGLIRMADDFDGSLPDFLEYER